MTSTTTDAGYGRRRFAIVSKMKKRMSQAALYSVLIGWGLCAGYPFYWLIVSSFKRPYEVFSSPFAFPKELLFSNYVDAWVLAHVGEMAQRSLYVTIASGVFAIVLASTVSYALSRFDFRGKGLLSGFLSMGFMVPETIRLLPLAIFSRKVGVYDNLVGLALIYAARRLPFNSFLLTAFMEGLPRELEEAAIMDGAGMWRVFWHITLPLSKPALVTVTTFQVLYSWNEFILALMLTKSFENRTLPVGMMMLIGEFFTNFPVLFAASVVGIIPGIVFFLVLQKQVVQGVAAGALKGV